jgi:hypothetical protein
MKRKKRSPRQKAVDNLDEWFSKYIRLRDSKDGYCTCITCGKVAYWTKEGMQAGHFQTRAKYSTRWDERNVNAQCAGCNMVNGGQQYIHGLEIDKKFGEGIADELVVHSNKIIKFTTQELIDMALFYKEKVGEFLK